MRFQEKNRNLRTLVGRSFSALKAEKNCDWMYYWVADIGTYLFHFVNGIGNEIPLFSLRLLPEYANFPNIYMERGNEKISLKLKMLLSFSLRENWAFQISYVSHLVFLVIFGFVQNRRNFIPLFAYELQKIFNIIVNFNI